MFTSWYQPIPIDKADIQVEQLELPSEIKVMLQELQLLYGVPLSYIIPDERLLPKESLRYFVIDINWIQALLDGFCSVGRIHPKDIDIDAIMLPTFFKQATVTRHHVRLQLLQQDTTPKLKEEDSTTGILLRSSLVQLYKGLEVKTDNSVTLLRMERLSDDILLCIFSGKLESISFCEPKESSTFGFLSNGSLPIKDIKTGAIDTKRSEYIKLKMNGRKVDIKKLASDLSQIYGQPSNASLIALAFIKNQWQGRVQFVGK